MIIGVDLHGVIDDDPEWFREILLDFIGDGEYKAFTIYIISGPSKEDIKKELEKYKLYQGLHFDEIISVVDYLKETGAEMWQDDRGRWWTHDKEWWEVKAKICEKYGVDLMIDDKKEWAPYFKNIETKFLLYGG
ncbi:hypothetical protein LCGC14_1997800 [marine sediment metagenome]|uniref:Uncharacterized protein n=1 Tax=marine sediment metagenome TaxID=412755 RepID=A0A0F9F3X3_9ZZZZ